MVYIQRKAAEKISKVLKSGKSILMLGPRQTGKTTLMEHVSADLYVSLADVRNRLRYEKSPGLLVGEIEALAEDLKSNPLIIIDEIQKIPLLMDVAQDLIDRKVAQFILTGSSARKLRKGKTINLLPGRVITIHMDPLSLDEIPRDHHTLEEWLFYGSLPEVVLTKDRELREELLESYITTYLEEEVRAEALVRDLGSFARFLELAASESGYPLNLSKLSQDIGVSRHTIAGFYEILEDCLVIERIEPISHSKSRRKLTKSQKYLFFDLGIRRFAAREGTKPPMSYLGHLFEQFVGLELIRLMRNGPRKRRLCYWRDSDGPEVDWVIDNDGVFTPIEVKFTDSPTLKDTRHVEVFLEEYSTAKEGFVICQTPKKVKLAPHIYALPWQALGEILD